MSNPFSGDPKSRSPDGDYLEALEKRLKGVKDKKKIDSKSIIKDIDSLKNDQLFKLLSKTDIPLSADEQKFENDFVEEQSILDKTIEPSLIRKKVAPQTCAINKTELVSILKYDVAQKLHDFYQQLDQTTEDRFESEEILREIQQRRKTMRKAHPRFGVKRTLRDQKRDRGFEILKKAHENNQTKFRCLDDRGTRKAFQKSSRMHILFSDFERPWETPFYKHTDYLSCALTWDGILAITSDREKRKHTWKEIDLIKLLTVAPSSRGAIFEVATSDVSLEQSDDCLAILAVFWVEINGMNTPTKCFGSIFRISKNLQVKLFEMIETPSMVGYCRLTDRKTFTHDYHCLIVFPKQAEVSAYLVDANSIKKIDDVFEWFPSLALTNLPGGALKSSCMICNDYRFSAVGLDTGILIVSVCMIQGNVILDSIRLKFACPITVVEFLPQVSSSIQRILVSSYLGPAAIWRIHLSEDEKLHWEQECIFAESQYYDSVICGCVYRFYHETQPWILLGTYSGKILRYELPPPLPNVRKSRQIVNMCGKPFLALRNKPIYNMKQTGLNEISVVTQFGLTVLQESLISPRRLSKFAYRWMEKYQISRFCDRPELSQDFTDNLIQKIELKSENEFRSRVGSSASVGTSRADDDYQSFTRRTTMNSVYQPRELRTAPSGSVSSSSSNSKLRQLEVEMFYQDGPSEQEQRSPNKIAQSPKMGAIQETNSLAERRSSSSNLFRFLPKKSSDQSLGKVFK
ncbi:unnamed protein product [Caenorhabditis angaria]|uniref:Uncharacterized protein n=1 Tax=Caenorhabditis angaria TaxID=860376 RepID=A0A9P1IWF0_9PELO|nr:unnamed protein product [Caenorhabditis angaria]